MRIILLRDIKGIGKDQDIKNVSDGYARNYLIPKGLAKPADQASIKTVELNKTARTREETNTRERMEKFQEWLKNQILRFEIRTGPKGEIFGSVAKKDIIEKILNLSESPDTGARLNKNDLENLEIALDRPIKTLGEHNVDISLGKGMSAKITIRLDPA